MTGPRTRRKGARVESLRGRVFWALVTRRPPRGRETRGKSAAPFTARDGLEEGTFPEDRKE